ncbi:MAG: DUF4294 domain-containing protein [Bacteroidota bacterium]
MHNQQTHIFSLFLTILLGFLIPQKVQAQTELEQDTTRRFKVYEYQGRTYMTGELDEIDITARRPSKRQLKRGRRRLARFTRLRWNVHKVYPYALKVSEVLQEIEKEVQGMDDDQRKAYLKSKEASLFGEYEDDLRRMTRSQGKMLVKLVFRETGQSTFALIKETKSGAAAVFWQSIGLIFGINLKTGYDSDEEENQMVEQIVADLERGGYNIAFKRYNYRLE